MRCPTNVLTTFIRFTCAGISIAADDHDDDDDEDDDMTIPRPYSLVFHVERRMRPHKFACFVCCVLSARICVHIMAQVLVYRYVHTIRGNISCSKVDDVVVSSKNRFRIISPRRQVRTHW